MSVFGIIGNKTADVASSVYYGLYALQHRGQESCGIVVNDDGLFRVHKDSGLVNDVFTQNAMKHLDMGKMAIGHVRYGTMQTKDKVNTEPFVVNHIKGKLAVAGQSSLVNYPELRRDLELQGAIFHSSCDAEIISYVITRERLTSGSIEEALNKAMNSLKGAFSLVIMSSQKLIATRDEMGMHPLCYGMRGENEYVIASESCALDAVGATFIREVEPGEIIVFSKAGIKTIKDHCNKQPERLCVFEYLYTARTDSVIRNCAIQAARKRAGAFLAKSHPVEADVVVGVPDSGLEAAIGYAEESGIPYGIGLIKNKYIGRTFIAPGQNVREDKVRIKLNPVVNSVRGKRIVLVDDSIVRGTTCARIVKLLHDAGANEIHLRSSAPKFLNPCYYGTDIESRDVLVACNHTTEEMEKIFGVDSLGFLEIEDVVKLGEGGSCKGYCIACFDGKYPTNPPSTTNRNKYDIKLSESES